MSTPGLPEMHRVVRSWSDLKRLVFHEMSAREYWSRVFAGLRMPRGTSEHAFARREVVRLWAPVAGVAGPLLAVLLVILWNAIPRQEIAFEETVVQLKPEPAPEDPVKPPDPPPPDPLTDPFKDVDAIVPSLTMADTAGGLTSHDLDASAQSTPQIASMIVDGVMPIRSIVSFPIPPGGPGIKVIGDTPEKPPVGVPTESAVLRALRWLKKNQEYDGSWKPDAGGCKTVGAHARDSVTANTALALISYLAHGETPRSEEFGTTVDKAMRWLVENQQEDGRFKLRDAHDYTLPIAAYALCEAYGMTRIPMVKDAARKSVRVIMNGQHASGGWNYNCNAENRDDTSYMAWCAQAIKSADMARIFDTEEGDKLKACMKKALDGFKKNYRKTDEYLGAFGYTAPGATGLTGAGVLCMQLLGGGNESEVSGGIKYLDNWKFDMSNPDNLHNPLYYWYYATQAKFQHGGDAWRNWNRMFAPELLKKQVVLKGAGVDGRDIGYWDAANQGEYVTSWVYNTTLCTLMLEVYYRFLPTYNVVGDAPSKGLQDAPPKGEIRIDVRPQPALVSLAR